MNLHDRILNYLVGHNVMTLATTGPDGPWASAVFYVNSGFGIYFLSAPTTRHSLNLVSENRVGATIQEDYSDWTKIKGIQLEGRVQRLSMTESVQAQALFSEKFPFTNQKKAVSVIATAMNKVAWYKLLPDALYLIDNSRGFGHREKLVLDGETRWKSEI